MFIAVISNVIHLKTNGFLYGFLFSNQVLKVAEMSSSTVFNLDYQFLDESNLLSEFFSMSVPSPQNVS